MIRFNSRAVRRSLVLGVLCLFAFARVAFASQACSFTATGGCLPLVIGVAAHGHGHDHGHSDVCAAQTITSQSTHVATSSDHSPGAMAPAMAIASIVPSAVERLRPVNGASTRRATSPLLAFGRLRL